MVLPLIVRNRATQDIRQHANYILIWEVLKEFDLTREDLTLGDEDE